MSNDKKSPEPRHTHYVSLSNNGVYPAMRSPSGFEDDNPKSWRPANSHEIQLYKEGKPLLTEVTGDEIDIADEAPLRAAPAALKLADDEPAAPAAFVPPSIPTPPVQSFVAPPPPPAPSDRLGPAKD